MAVMRITPLRGLITPSIIYLESPLSLSARFRDKGFGLIELPLLLIAMTNSSTMSMARTITRRHLKPRGSPLFFLAFTSLATGDGRPAEKHAGKSLYLFLLRVQGLP